MNPIKSNFSIHEPLSRTFEQTQLDEAATGVSESRDVTLYHNNNSPFLELPELIHSKIIRCLGLREVTRLAKVCKYFRDLVKQNIALERAWNRRFPSFPSPHQYQLKTTINTKDEHQLRAWLKPFANKETIELLIKQQENIHFPAQLLFTNSKLMTLCKKFELVEKLEITHGDRVYEANFSPDGQHLVTASRDKTAKIYGLEDDGSWKRKAIITHDEWVRTAIFSPDGRYLITAGHDATAKIYGLEDDGSWEEKTIITHNNYLVSATFIGDGRRVVTASFGDSVKITGRGNNESWELEDAFHKNTICSTRLSPDGHHMIIFYAVNFVIEIHGQSAAGLWAVTSTIQTESGARSARFSADSCHLVIITFASTAIICDLLADGSWKKMGTIKHGFWIKSANFSADCLHVVTASEDHKAKIHSQNAGSWEEK
ncbi:MULTISPECIES: F-box/WD40 repeat-containing protein, partial [unclassified Endozoicomonas]